MARPVTGGTTPASRSGTARQGASRRLGFEAVGRGVAVCVLPMVVGLWMAATTFIGGTLIPWRPHMVDLDVYRRAGETLLEGGDFYALPGPLPFDLPAVRRIVGGSPHPAAERSRGDRLDGCRGAGRFGRVASLRLERMATEPPRRSMRVFRRSDQRDARFRPAGHLPDGARCSRSRAPDLRCCRDAYCLQAC